MSYSVTENHKGQDALDSILKQMKNSYVKVGFPEGKEPGKPTRKGSGSEGPKSMADMALIAATQEFGTTKAGRGNKVTIPPRPFMRPALFNNRRKLSTLTKKLSTDILDGSRTVNSGLSLIGEFMVNSIKKAINDVDSPANAPSTIAAKGSSKPLIDTGRMKNSVSYLVLHGTEKKEVEKQKTAEKV